MSKRGSKYWQLNNREWLYKKYWVEELGAHTIAKIVGCGINTVWNALKNKDVETRKKKECKDCMQSQLDNKRWLQQKYWQEGLSAREIAIITKCFESRIFSSLKKHGIKRRTHSEAIKGEKNYFYGKHLTEKTKKKISGANTKLTPTQRHLNKNISQAINKSLKNQKNGRHWETIVGYTTGDLMQTLEKEFRPGMAWENYGEWHVDHIVPLAKFAFDSTEDPEFKKAWALNNLQPLWADENMKKGTKYMFF